MTWKEFKDSVEAEGVQDDAEVEHADMVIAQEGITLVSEFSRCCGVVKLNMKQVKA